MTSRKLTWPNDYGISWFCTGRDTHERTVPVAYALSFPHVPGRPIGTMAAELVCPECGRSKRPSHREQQRIVNAGLTEFDISQPPL